MDLFKEYREIKDQLNILEEKKREVEMKIFDYLDSDGQTGKETQFGSFFIMGRKTYEYSSVIKQMQDEVAKKKKIEELDGTATLKSDLRYLRLVLPKDK